MSKYEFKKPNAVTIIGYSILGCCLLGILIWLVYRNVTSDVIGTFEVKLIDVENEVADEKTISFEKDDTLVELLKEEFDPFVIKDGYVSSIGELKEYTLGNTLYYISLIVDGEYSTVGVNSIKLVDGLEISFVMEQYSYV